MTEIHRVSVQLRRPMGNDPGTVEQACYFIDKGNVVVLCHRDGSAPPGEEDWGKARWR